MSSPPPRDAANLRGRAVAQEEKERGEVEGSLSAVWSVNSLPVPEHYYLPSHAAGQGTDILLLTELPELAELEPDPELAPPPYVVQRLPVPQSSREKGGGWPGRPPDLVPRCGKTNPSTGHRCTRPAGHGPSSRPEHRHRSTNDQGEKDESRWLEPEEDPHPCGAVGPPWDEARQGLRCTRPTGHDGRHHNEHYGRTWRTPWRPVHDAQGHQVSLHAPNARALAAYRHALGLKTIPGDELQQTRPPPPKRTRTALPPQPEAPLCTKGTERHPHQCRRWWHRNTRGGKPKITHVCSLDRDHRGRCWCACDTWRRGARGRPLSPTQQHVEDGQETLP